MPQPSDLDVIRPGAERFAQDWLALHGWCDCPGQVQVITVRLLPVVAMFERELRRGFAQDWENVHMRLVIYSERAERALAKGLHRPGASAAIPEERRGPNGIGPHC